MTSRAGLHVSSDGIGVIIGDSDPIRYRQFDIWWDTTIAGPTSNTAGVSGNDFPGAYFHDATNGVEHFLFYRGEVNWSEFSFRRQVVRGQVVFGLYGGALEEAMFEHHSRPRESLPTRWEALTALIEWALQFLPSSPDSAELPDFRKITGKTFAEIVDPATALATVNGVTGHLMYVAGTSKAWSDDEVNHLELLAQSDVAWGLSLLGHGRSAEQSAWLSGLIETIGEFFDERSGYFTNIFPTVGSEFAGGNVIVARENGRESTNVWYHTYNHARLAEIALMNGGVAWEPQLKEAVNLTLQLGSRTLYTFPLFWWVDNGDSVNGADDPASAGAFAWLMVRAFDLWGDEAYLGAAADALKALRRRGMDHLYGESTLLPRAAWAANALAKRLKSDEWLNIRNDFVAASLRMMYWRGPHTGMFQACAGICYPALFENVGIALALDEFLDDTPFPLRQILGLQLRANALFFDGVGPGASVPHENLGTVEYPYPGEVGKEIYAAGEALNLPYLQDRYLGAPSREPLVKRGVRG